MSAIRLDEEHAASRLIFICFAAIYLIWGSTYLAIHFLIQTIPPFGAGSARFILAGAALYLLARWRGNARPKPRQWLTAGLAGLLMTLCGNGIVMWAQQRVPSGLAAVLVTTTPMWMVLLGVWLREQRFTLWMGAGLGLGFGGVALLVLQGSIDGPLPLVNLLMIPLASACFSAGAFLLRRGDLPASSLMSSGMQMLAGGALFGLCSLVAGEWRNFDPAGVSAISLAALAYLIVFGSIIAYSAFSYLARRVSPAQLATYAYVNPLIAVLLGWLLGHESFSASMALGAGLVIGAVILLMRPTRQ